MKDGDKVLDSKDVTLSNTEQQHVDLTFKADKAGARYLTVSVPPQPEEAEVSARQQLRHRLRPRQR